MIIVFFFLTFKQIMQKSSVLFLGLTTAFLVYAAECIIIIIIIKTCKIVDPIEVRFTK